MSSLADVSAGLCLVLSLAASSGDGPGADRLAPGVGAPGSPEGPYSFSEQIWLGAIKSGAGVSEGSDLASLEDRIFTTTSGRHYVPEPEVRSRILKLRRDAGVARQVAFALAMQHGQRLEKILGRRVRAEELFVAHRLGAAAMIESLEGTQGKGRNGAARPVVSAQRATKQGLPARIRSLADQFSSTCASHGEAGGLLAGAYGRLVTAIAEQETEAKGPEREVNPSAERQGPWTAVVRVAHK